MCGIAGVFHLEGAPSVDRDYLERTNEVQRHRGPDESSVLAEPGVGLAHRRLSIIDVAGSHQPLYNEDGSVAVVYNGEIYNFADLTRTLVRAGHRFRTVGDTETIVHGWEEWGEDCVTRFRGMFTFALWDRNRDCLLLARDRLGIKPLYYAPLDGGEVIFASELKGLLCHPRLPRRLDPRAVEEFFALGYVPDPSTVFRGVYKLPPAHTLLLERGRPLPEPRPYWDVPAGPPHSFTVEEAAEELRSRLREAVRIRLVSEVPLGGFLSGGVDSSAVVATMAGLSESPVNTCTISFGDPAFDEAAYAARVAERYHTDHLVRRVDPDDFSLVDALAGIYDEPFADSSALPTYRLCELARTRVTVALSGDGGDELLAGYRRQRMHMAEERIRSAVPSALRRPLFGLLGSLYPKADWAPRLLRAKTTLQALAMDPVDAYCHSVSIVDEALRRELYSPTLLRELQGYRAVERFREHARHAPDGDALGLVQYLDIKTYLPGDILTKVDRASMAHSLEVRVPLLDHELVEWLSRLPSALKLRGGEGKFLLKKAFEPHVPHDILYRAKMGFSVPIGKWFNGPLRETLREMVSKGPLAECGLLEPAVLRRMVEQHQSGTRDHTAPLWSALMFGSFLRRWA